MKENKKKGYGFRLDLSDEEDLEVHEILSSQRNVTSFLKSAVLYYADHNFGKDERNGSLEETVMSAVAKVLLIGQSGQVQPSLSALLSSVQEPKPRRRRSKKTAETLSRDENESVTAKKVVPESMSRTSEEETEKETEKYDAQTRMATPVPTEKVVPDSMSQTIEKVVPESKPQEEAISVPEMTASEEPEADIDMEMLDMFDSLMNSSQGGNVF